MHSVLIIERDARRAIEIGQSLSRLGMSLHHMIDLSDIDQVLARKSFLALVVGDPRDRRILESIVNKVPSPNTPIFSYHSASQLRRSIGALRLKTGYNCVIARSDAYFEFGSDFTLSEENHALSHANGKTIALAKTEFAITFLLAGNLGNVVYKSDILNELWGRSDRCAVRSLDVHIFGLRQKIRGASIPLEILSIRRIGFIMNRNIDTRQADKPLPQEPVVLNF